MKNQIESRKTGFINGIKIPKELKVILVSIVSVFFILLILKTFSVLSISWLWIFAPIWVTMIGAVLFIIYLIYDISRVKI